MRSSSQIPGSTAAMALSLLMTLGAAGCNRSGASPNASAAADLTRVEVRAAVQRKFRGALPITGELRPIREVTMKSRIGGNVVELNFDEGDRVKKGDLIARIEDTNQQAQLKSARAAVQLAEAQVERARAELERAHRDRARIEALYARGAIDKKTLDDSQTGGRLAEAALRTAEAQLGQAQAGRDGAQNGVNETQYRAPFDGVISRRGVSLHEYIDTFKNRDIVSIVDNSAMELVASVPADLAAGVQKGGQVEFAVGALQGKTLTGEIVAVNPAADARTRMVRLRVRLPNQDGLLKGGMYATGVVIVGGERTSVGVPAQAVHQTGEGGEDGSVVWRIKGGAADRVAVRTGAQDGDLIEVLSGLDPGDQVVISSPAALRPGAAVSVKPAAGAKAEGT